MKKIQIIPNLFIIIFLQSMIFAQNGWIDFKVNWTPYVTYYLSMVDINTGESNMPIFLATLERNTDTPGVPDEIDVNIEFEIIIDSDALFVSNETLVKVETIEPLKLSAPIQISNMDLNLSTDALFDNSGNPVELRLDITKQMDFTAAEEMMSSIIQTGQLPNGIYTFRVTATAENGQQIIRQDILNISNPDLLELVSPGGILADTIINEVYTSYPVFQWESDPCNYTNLMTDISGCAYYIRVSEFKTDEHSSIDQAIESVTRLPLDQNLGFYEIGFGINTFQYPTDAGDLQPGRVYVWQIRKDIVTTSGTEQLLSNIMAFKVKDFSANQNDSAGPENSSPVAILLRNLIGDDLTNSIFGPDGDAKGMTVNGNIILNGDNIDISVAQSLLSSGLSVEDENGNQSYRPIEIISVEVSD